MTANFRGLKFIALLLTLVLVLGIGACGRSKGSKSKSKAQQQSVSKAPTRKSLPSRDNSGAKEEPAPKLNLPPGEFGRENPFMPLVGRRTEVEVSKPVVEKKEEEKPKPEERKPEPPKPLPVVSLTAIVGQNAAIFEENGVSRTVSTGDTVAGLNVLEIRRGEVVLGKGSKKYTVTLGVVPASIIASANE